MFKIWRTKIKFLFCKLFGRYYVALKCGHKTKSIAKVNIFGEKFILYSPKAEYCSDCIAKMSIRCAWCGKSIKVGDPITLNTPGKKSFGIPAYAVKYGEKYPIRLIGCLRRECADELDRAGFWIVPGKVYRVMSPQEIAIANRDCFIINDLTDPNQAIPFPYPDE